MSSTTVEATSSTIDDTLSIFLEIMKEKMEYFLRLIVPENTGRYLMDVLRVLDASSIEEIVLGSDLPYASYVEYSVGKRWQKTTAKDHAIFEAMIFAEQNVQHWMDLAAERMGEITL